MISNQIRKTVGKAQGKYLKIISVTVVAALFNILPVSAQQRDDFLRPFTGYYDSQSLTTAIGNATVASGQLIPGRTNNPANLGLNRFGHLQINFQHNSFDGHAADATNTGFGGIYGVMPVQVYRGSLVFGGGVQKILDFTGGSHTTTKQISEEGGLYSTDLGLSVETAENFFVGAAFHYLKGSDELSTTELETNRLLNPKYSGYYLDIGFLNRTTPNLQIGATVQFPRMINVRDKLTSWPVVAPEESVSETWNYTVAKPLTFNAGFSLLYPMYGLMYELEWTDWSGLEFSSDEYYDGDVAEINRELKSELNATLSHKLGGVFHVPSLPLHLYAGYQYLPVPFSGEYESDRKQALSFGVSNLLNQQFSVHSSYSRYFWKYHGNDEHYSMFVLGVTMHY